MSAFRLFSAVLFLLLLQAALPNLAQAQVVVTEGPDSVRIATKPVADSTRRTERLLGLPVTRPQKAALLALVLPGAGQVYNHRYWKLPLVYGGLGGVGYGLYHYQILYRQYVDGKNQLLDNPGMKISELSGDDVKKERSVENIQRGIVFYRRNRDTFIAYTALVYGVTILDALVDAHLRDFDISEDLSLRLEPALLPGSGIAPRAGLALSLHMK